MTARRRLVCILPAAVLGACMVSRPIDDPVPKLGSTVTADLTDAGSVGMARWVGPSVTEIRGQVVTASEAELSLSVRVVRTRAGRETDWNGEQVDIPQNWIRSLQREVFSPTRTALLAVVTAGVAFLGYQIAGGGEPASAPPAGGGGPRPN